MKKILLIGIALVCVWLLVKPHKPARTLTPTPPAQKMPAKKVEKPQVALLPEGESKPVASAASDAALVKPASTLRQAGFHPLKIDKVNGYWQLRIKFISSTKKCEMGDLDLIRIDQKRRGVQSLIMALDDMGAHKNVTSQSLDVNSLDGSAVTLKWKAADSLRSLALQICSDAQSQNSCLYARQGDVNQPLMPGKPAAGVDRAYYFQFIQEGPSLALLDASRAQAKDPKQLAAAFKAGGLDNREASDLAQEVARKHTEIGSMAAQFEDKMLVINLPHNDPSCPLPNLKF